MYFCKANVSDMNLKQGYIWLFDESKQLILEPKKFWQQKSEAPFTGNIVIRFYAPLVIAVGIAVFLGEVISKAHFLWSYATMKALREMISYFLQFFITVPILATLHSNFGGMQNKRAISQVLAYSLLPFLLTSFVTGLFPALDLLSIVGLYGFYLFILGCRQCLSLTKENHSRFILLSILLIILIFGMINLISWKLLQAIFQYGA